MGNDFYPGISGIGPKRALDIVREYGNANEIQGYNLIRKDGKEYNDYEDYIRDIEKVRKIIQNPKINKEYKIKKKKPDLEELENFMIYKHNFSETRIKNGIKKLRNHYLSLKQTSIMDYDKNE
jgi:flap endonuclease-1